MLSSYLHPPHKAGWPFIAGFLGLSVILGLLWPALFWIGLLATAWCVYFFRDPPRVVPLRPGLLVSPADGRIQAIETVPPLPELEMGDQPLCRVSIFLDIFDVHVNRVAAEGTVARLTYRPGKFFNAALDKASEQNERQSVAIDLEDGRRVGMVQIAGLVARRIVCELELGQQVRRGERFGLIRFGSRTDLFLPPGSEPLVAVGQRAIGGETVICDLASSEPRRLAEVS